MNAMQQMARAENEATRNSWNRDEDVSDNLQARRDKASRKDVMAAIRSGFGVEDIAMQGICTAGFARGVVADLRAKGVLGLMWRGKPVRVSPTKAVSRIISEAAKAHGLTRKQILTGRQRRTVAARQDCMASIRRETDATVVEVAKIFGFDHSTVISAIAASERRATQ